MLLATQCPACHTTFRLASDQLKLRNGLVRCGTCHTVFDGSAYLQPILTPHATAHEAPFSDQQPSQETSQPATDNSGTSAPPALSAAFASIAAQTDNAPWLTTSVINKAIVKHSPVADSRSSLPPPSEPHPNVWLTRKSQDNDVEPEPIDHDDNDGIPIVMADDRAHELPEFVRVAQTKKRFPRLKLAMIAIATILLLTVLLGQSIYWWHLNIATSIPATQPLLARACTFLHCPSDLSSEIEQLSLESAQLQLVPPHQHIYTLTFLLRNRSQRAQAWPHLELTLNDTDGKAIIRKVFSPHDYLPADTFSQLITGIAENSEQQQKIFFELPQTTIASGYRLYLFYP